MKALQDLLDKQIALEVFQTVVFVIVAALVLVHVVWPGKGSEEEADEN